MPKHITGSEFIARYKGTTDAVTSTTIAHNRTYAVRKPAAHAVYEHFRVRTFAELLQMRASERRDELLGELMYQSHASYSACGLGSKGTDLTRRTRARSSELATDFTARRLPAAAAAGRSPYSVVKARTRRSSRLPRSITEAMNYTPYIFTGSSSGQRGIRLHQIAQARRLFLISDLSHTEATHLTQAEV
ncbi:MAG: hypothetical protein WKF84_23110 [Pyrinomonadaceae bacterium]